MPGRTPVTRPEARTHRTCIERRMPYTIRDDLANGVILVRWTGRLSAAEVLRYTTELYDLDGHRRGNPGLHDARAWDVDVPAAEIRRIVYNDVAEPPRRAARRVALVVGGDLAYGMLRMYCTLREDTHLAPDVFRDMEAAKAWLGLAHIAGDPFAGWD